MDVITGPCYKINRNIFIKETTDSRYIAAACNTTVRKEQQLA